MFQLKNKRLSLSHIMMAEWLEETVSAKHSKRGAVTMYGLKITLSNGHEEAMFYDIESERHDAWTSLLSAMEKAGH